MQEEFEEKYEDTNPHFTQDELEYLKELIGETLYEFHETAYKGGSLCNLEIIRKKF